MIPIKILMENKQLICDLLCKALQQTSEQDELERLEYDPQTEIVTARWSGDISKRINVAMDSDMTMIRDIMRSLDD